MSETIYKIGDVLEDIQTGDKYLIIFFELEGLSQREYKTICYDTHKTFLFNWLSESFLIKKTKRLGNIDISLLVGGKKDQRRIEMDSKFKAGDILKFEDGMRAIVASCYPQATNSNEYLYYLWSWYKGAIDWDSWSESELVNKVKIIDQIDISSVVGDEKSNERDDRFHVICTKEDFEQAQEVEKAWVKAADICDEYDALEAKAKKLTDECESLRNNLKDATEAYNRQTACHEAWKQGWYECLKTFNYYLGTNDDKDDWC